MPKVSVIVPVYKVEQYLCRCVDSVLSQTFSDFELILVDDGSPDNCGAICDAYAAKDNRVIVIHKENGGLSNARNAGLDVATGRYLYFLDSDDFVKPELLATVLPHMDAGADLVAFSWNSFYPDGHEELGHSCKAGTFLLSEENRLFFLLETLLTFKIGWAAWDRIFRRELVESHRIRFADNKVIFAEDLYFSLCYCAHARKIVSIPDVLHSYLRRDDSIMGQNKCRLNAGRMNELAKAVLWHYAQYNDCSQLVQHFSVIHYMIVDNAVTNAMRDWGYTDVRTFRELLKKNIADWDFYTADMKQVGRYENLLRRIYPAEQLAERMNLVRYYCSGNYVVLRIRNRMLYWCNFRHNR